MLFFSFVLIVSETHGIFQMFRAFVMDTVRLAPPFCNLLDKET